MNYYNENDKYCAQWLRNLVDAAFIPDGDVDERSIVDVSAAEVKGYTQCHFFAGIGGWSYALRLAGWGEDRRVWTGSCPCQPFSVAGQRKGKEDARHLWPDFHRLIREVRPPTVLGEQVSGTAGYVWLDGVCDDLAEEGYQCDAIDIPACSVGAPHIRQRLYWVAHPGHARMRGTAGAGEEASGWAFGEAAGCGDGSAADGLGHPNGSRPQGRRQHSGEYADQRLTRETGQLGGVGQSEGQQMGNAGLAWGRSDAADGMADADGRITGDGRIQRGRQYGLKPQDGGTGFWSDYSVVHCTDGKARRTKPGLFPLAHGISGRVDKLRAIGNAIIPELAAEVIRAWMETMPR